MGYEDHDLCVKGLSVLIANLGNGAMLRNMDKVGV